MFRCAMPIFLMAFLFMVSADDGPLPARKAPAKTSAPTTTADAVSVMVDKGEAQLDVVRTLNYPCTHHLCFG